MSRWRLPFVVIARFAPVVTAGALAAGGEEARTSSARGAVKLVTPRRPLPGPWQGRVRQA